MKPVILITAYAVNPYKGSEDGTAWNYIIQSARFNNVIAITRKNNKEHIESFMTQNTNEGFGNLSFKYFDLPYWMRFWKKGTIGALIYFYMWQLFMPVFIYMKKIKFDIAHNLNFHNDWIPTFLWVYRKPLVWGPIGHHPSIPASYIIRTYGYKALFIDRTNDFIKRFIRRVDPFMYIALWRADMILAVNSETIKKFPWVNNKIKLFSAIGGNRIEYKTNRDFLGKFIVFSAGRFEPIKGFDIAIHSYNRFCEKLTLEELNDVEFLIAGSGIYQKELSEISKECAKPNSIKIMPWVAKEDMNSLYEKSSVFFFPSHEGAGMVIPEALSNGLPVLCFNNAGPGESTDLYSALRSEYTTYDQSVEEFSNHLLCLFRNREQMKTMSEAAKARFLNVFEWNHKGDLLNEIYIQIQESYEKKYCSYTSA